MEGAALIMGDNGMDLQRGDVFPTILFALLRHFLFKFSSLVSNTYSPWAHVSCWPPGNSAQATAK